MSEIESSGAAVTPEDPQRQRIPAEMLELAAVALADRFGENTISEDYENARVALAAAFAWPGLLGHLLTSQGYERSDEHVQGGAGILARTSWVSPWTPIGPEKGANE